MATNSPIELLIALGIDDAKTRGNIQSYINTLQKNIPDLDVLTLKVQGDSGNSKVFAEMEKQIKSLESQITHLEKQLGMVGSGKVSNNLKLTESIRSDLKLSEMKIKDWLKDVENLKNFDLKLDAKVNTETGLQELKQFTATVKNELGEVEKLTYRIGKDGGFSRITESLKNNDIAITKEYKDVVAKLGEAIVSIERTGQMSSGALKGFKEELASANIITKPTNENLNNLKNTVSELNMVFKTYSHANKMNEAMNEASRGAQNLQSRLEKVLNAYKRTVDSAKASEIQSKINSLPTPVFTNDTQVKKYKNDLRDIETQITSLQSKATEASRNNMTMLNQFKIAMERFPIWMAASTVFYQSVNGIKDLTEKVIELDTAMVNLARVTDLNDQQLNNMLEKSIDNVTELSGKMTEYLEILNEVARMGIGDADDTLALTNVTQVLTNISDLDAKQAIDSLIAGMIAFNIEAQDAIDIADKLNEVDNNFSITSQNLALSLNKAASTAKTFGVTLDELIGYTTAIGSATRESGKYCHFIQ